MDASLPFRGAKIALLTPAGLIVLRRDDNPAIAHPGAADLPGGLRDPGECPMTCIRREVREETGIDLPVSSVIWARLFSRPDKRLPEWFFVARLDAETGDAARLMDEGQALWREPPEVFAARADAVPHLRHMLGVYLAEAAGAAGPEKDALPYS